MSVHVLWHGGPNYADPWITDDLELFDDVDAAREALISRERNGHWQRQDVYKRSGEQYSTFFPTVQGSFMEIFHADPLDEDGNANDTEPDEILYYDKESNDE